MGVCVCACVYVCVHVCMCVCIPSLSNQVYEGYRSYHCSCTLSSKIHPKMLPTLRPHTPFCLEMEYKIVRSPRLQGIIVVAKLECVCVLVCVFVSVWAVCGRMCVCMCVCVFVFHH